MSKAIFREYIGVKPSSKSLRDFPTHIINSNISEFHFILGFAKEVYEAKKGTGVFKETWNVEYFGPEEVRILKKAKKNVKVIISIGGGDNKTPFHPAVEEEKWVKAAVDSLKAIILKYKDENGASLIDGIDIHYHTISTTGGDTNSRRFATYIGNVIKTLKSETALLIKEVSIAPCERNLSHYRTLFLEFKEHINYVNYQFYKNPDLIDTIPSFVKLYNKAAEDFKPAKVLPGFSSEPDIEDEPAENNLQRNTFIGGCVELIRDEKLTPPFPGVFLWNAHESAITPSNDTTPFLVEHVLQSLLLAPPKKN
jgi:hypothetical protein